MGIRGAGGVSRALAFPLSPPSAQGVELMILRGQWLLLEDELTSKVAFVVGVYVFG